MSPEKKIDDVLKALNSAYIKSISIIKYKDGNITVVSHPDISYRYVSMSDLFISVMFENLNDDEINRDVSLIIDFLLDNGLVGVTKTNTIPARDDKYYITWKGRVLIENGGYTKEKELREQKERISELKYNMTIAGAWLAGIGSILLVIIEVLKNAKWVVSIEAGTLAIILLMGILLGISIWQLIRPQSKN